MTHDFDTIDATSHFLRACERADVDTLCHLLEAGDVDLEQVAAQGALMVVNAPLSSPHQAQCLTLLLPFCDPLLNDGALLRHSARLKLWDVCRTLFQKANPIQQSQVFRALEPFVVACDQADVFSKMWDALPDTAAKTSKGFSIFTACLRQKSYFIASHLCANNAHEDMYHRYTLSYAARTQQQANQAQEELAQFSAWKQKQRLLTEVEPSVGSIFAPKPKKM